jgi:hypothetical protein
LNRSCSHATGKTDFAPSRLKHSDERRKQSRNIALLGALLFFFGVSCGPVLAQSSAVYGSGINSDALDNLTVGPSGRQVSYRFVANHTGTVSNVRFYVIATSTKAGYSAGNGGNLLVQLETDDGTSSHLPSGTSLGSYSISDPSAGFPTVTLSPAPKLEAGTLYHLVFTNTNSSPSSNYVSLDELYMYHPLSPMQPLFSNVDCATLTRTSSQSWSVFDYTTPIFQIDFSDGSNMGQGYMEVWPEVPQVIGGTHAVREQFTVSGGTRTVATFGIRVARTSGAAGLAVRLETSNGTLIEEGYIPSSSIPLSSSSSPNYVWATYTFSAIRTLYSGDGYHVDLEASSGTTYQVFPIRKGGYYNFPVTTYFHDGYAQFKSGSSWVGWTQWGQTNRTDADLQFYFAP